MLYSMTGYGENIYEDDDIKITVSLKSLNSKNLDIKIKSNYLIDNQEIAIKNLISKKMIRGKIDCNIFVEEKNEKSKYKINKNVFIDYYEQLKVIGDSIGKNNSECNLFQTIMSLPQTIEPRQTEAAQFIDIITKTTEAAIEKITEFRLQEGKATATVLNGYLNNISNLLQQVPQYEDERIQNVKRRLNQALESTELKIDKERFEAEIIFYLEKYDIQEEKTRLKNHIEYFKQTMDEDFSGKKLGFITQEMGREINTLGSKANHVEIQKLVVQMKDELEKIKEQILNIL